MKSCRDVCENAHAYADRALPFWQRVAIRLHLALCRNCAAFVDQAARTRALLATGLMAERADTDRLTAPSPELLAALDRGRRAQDRPAAGRHSEERK